MKKFPAILVVTFFVLSLFSGAASARWSLLEDYQMCDIAGDEGLCLASIKKACDFDVLEYTGTYPYDALNDDMNESMNTGLEMIFSEYFYFHPYVPYPAVDTTFVPPVPGDPFFQSDWYPPDYAPLGWDNLYEDLLGLLPPP
jgi:hypothetical protein